MRMQIQRLKTFFDFVVDVAAGGVLKKTRFLVLTRKGKNHAFGAHAFSDHVSDSDFSEEEFHKQISQRKGNVTASCSCIIQFC